MHKNAIIKANSQLTEKSMLRKIEKFLIPLTLDRFCKSVKPMGDYTPQHLHRDGLF